MKFYHPKTLHSLRSTSLQAREIKRKWSKKMLVVKFYHIFSLTWFTFFLDVQSHLQFWSHPILYSCNVAKVSSKIVIQTVYQRRYLQTVWMSGNDSPEVLATVHAGDMLVLPTLEPVRGHLVLLEGGPAGGTHKIHHRHLQDRKDIRWWTCVLGTTDPSLPGLASSTTMPMIYTAEVHASSADGLRNTTVIAQKLTTWLIIF